jgi:hypothetical protein
LIHFGSKDIKKYWKITDIVCFFMFATRLQHKPYTFARRNQNIRKLWHIIIITTKAKHVAHMNTTTIIIMTVD